MSGAMSLLVVFAVLVVITLSVWFAAYRQEAVLSTYAVACLLLIIGALFFSVRNAAASGPLVILVQFMGMAVVVFMLWHHWFGDRERGRPIM